MSQVDPSVVRQRVQQARELVAKGAYGRARALLKGIDHPKAQALLAELEAKAPSRRVRSPFLPMAGLLLSACLCAGLGLFWLSRRPEPASEPLPTLVPTESCTAQMVQAWWLEQQNTTFGRFGELVSMASRTMPGERLAATLEELEGLRASLLPLPRCATPAQREHLVYVEGLMGQALRILEDWQRGALDGTSLSNAIILWERAWQTRHTTWPER